MLKLIFNVIGSTLISLRIELSTVFSACRMVWADPEIVSASAKIAVKNPMVR
jgi:hypothetical protein